jgi:hypothetical protein
MINELFRLKHSKALSMEEEETRKPIKDRIKPEIRKPTRNKLPEFCSTVSSYTESIYL